MYYNIQSEIMSSMMFGNCSMLIHFPTFQYFKNMLLLLIKKGNVKGSDCAM